MNVLKVGEKILIDLKDRGLFNYNQSSSENGLVSMARWWVQRQSKVEKKYKIYQQLFSVLLSSAESVKTVNKARGEVFFKLKKEIKKGGGTAFWWRHCRRAAGGWPMMGREGGVRKKRSLNTRILPPFFNLLL